MDTVSNTPLIGNADCVIIGGSISCLSAALFLANHNHKVTLIVKETFLVSDLCSPSFYYLENIENKSDRYFNIIFDESTDARDVAYEEGRVLHPDRLKLNAEDVCKNNGIQYIYAAVPIDILETEDSSKILRFVCKSGIFGISCRMVLNLNKDRVFDRYMVNVMGAPDIKGREIIRVLENSGGGFNVTVRPGAYGKGHASLDIPIGMVKANANDGLSEYKLKRHAFDIFKWIKQNAAGYSNIRLGRSGMEGFSSSLDAEGEIERGIRAAKDIMAGEVQIPLSRAALPIPRSMAVVSCNPMADYREYDTYRCPPPMASRIINADLVVAGGGTSGVMAAIYAARRGIKTVLIELNKQCGGTGTVGGVSTYWFGKRLLDTMEVDLNIDSIYKELGLHRNTGIWSDFDDFNPDIKSAVLAKMCWDAGVEILFGTVAFAAVIEEGSGKHLRGVMAASPGETVAVLGKYVIDATGDGDIAVFAGADHAYGTGRDVFTYWASLAQYTTPEKYRNNFSSTVMVSDPMDYTRFISLGRRRGETYDHGTYAAPRETRHIKGMYEITLKDAVTFKNYSDAVYTCFSNYDPKGKLTADMVYGGVLPPPVSIAVPLRALLPVDENGDCIKGLLVAGKAISCTHNAFPGMRMQPDLQHQGAVLGIIASSAIRENVDILGLNIDVLQQKIRTVTKDELKVPGQKYLTEGETVSAIGAGEKLDWVDLPFTEEIKDLPVSIRVMTAETENILPELEVQFSYETDKLRKLSLARFMLWHGSDMATGFIMDEIMEELLLDNGLPKRRGSTICAQLLPDHGVMAEIVYKLNLLAFSKRSDIYKPFEEVFKRLLDTERDYLDIRKSIYHYIESFAYVAERTCVKEFIPMLKVLAELPELRQAASFKGSGIDILEERLVILELSIYRALARCGDIEGYDGLVSLLDNDCASVAVSACMELQVLTGSKIGINSDRWKELVHSVGFNSVPCPIEARIW